MVDASTNVQGDDFLYFDNNVLNELPSGCRVISIRPYDGMKWVGTAKIKIATGEGSTQSFFLKARRGDHGKRMIHGEFCSMLALHRNKSDLVPKPLAWGTYEKKPDVHFFLYSFHDITSEAPDHLDFPTTIAEMHESGISKGGKFGCPFKSDSGRPITTYQGQLPQHDGVYDTWEEYFSADIKHFFELEEVSQGPDDEMVKLKKGIVDQVIPRLLRPLKGKIDPTLVHGNLCDGNASIDEATQLPIIFNASCLYAHNEYELAPWRQKRHKLNDAYIINYSIVIPKSEPKADFDDRNALYSVRFNLYQSAMQPRNPSFRNILKEEMDELVTKFPDGYEGYLRGILPGTG